MLLNSLAHTTLDESGQDDHCGLVTSSCGINKVVRKPLPDDHLRRPDLPSAPFYGSEPRPKRADRLRPWWRTIEATWRLRWTSGLEEGLGANRAGETDRVSANLPRFQAPACLRRKPARKVQRSHGIPPLWFAPAHFLDTCCQSSINRAAVGSHGSTRCPEPERGGPGGTGATARPLLAADRYQQPNHFSSIELTMKTWRLDELTFQDTRDRAFDVAVLPLGATEPHNLHLPYGTDLFEATIIGDHICQEATRRGARVLLLPTIPYGTETNLREFPYAMNLNPSTLLAVIRDLVASLERSGIRKLLLLNSHGGNEFKPVLRELYGQTSVHLFLCNWFQMVADRYSSLFTHRDDHAGEMETSFALAYFPALVRHRDDGRLQADEGQTATSRFQAVNQGWVTITRPWHLLTTNTGSGNPHAASAEKGHRLMELLVQRLAAFLVELGAAEVDTHFPFAGPASPTQH